MFASRHADQRGDLAAAAVAEAEMVVEMEEAVDMAGTAEAVVVAMTEQRMTDLVGSDPNRTTRWAALVNHPVSKGARACLYVFCLVGHMALPLRANVNELSML